MLSLSQLYFCLFLFGHQGEYWRQEEGDFEVVWCSLDYDCLCFLSDENQTMACKEDTSLLERECKYPTTENTLSLIKHCKYTK